ncbi:molybdenum cofactor guanylyltransferase [Heyndrickxia ginsengihumi]|uniref:Probable molybdenum cofactor guanylyltransferase n=1 Tax=Heyndrickxia ginsengihumi TaxID=363870 RepID=A0A0A6VFA3_9BACI|nr:molybdenum cofactor guanylyltransferase [Heyndrickxia ginsengihumi]KHD85249.1 molybdopterin-guanine dinucleotide biosynthesis protein A [Heyndrickxia ginsengihumi]MBE6184558.1 molybdenum cofactor guanylyltransferase [Bacillus sp. (in: firmicutes)]MCM3024491.1 molybdenum cofactor guanylyltransferase [Heyndrickxia ginsengihumi]NEY21654.1 molybdenum cofactor guanylyltransferase [Heyndrickxia ginsengihumi]
MTEYAAIVLAGGMSRRFGDEKAIAKWNDKLFISYSLEAVNHVEQTIIVTRDDLLSKVPQLANVQLITDAEAYKGKGPLAGIYSGMTRAEAEWYVVLPCDTPWINKTIMKQLQAYCDGQFEAIVSKVNGCMQPLIGIYHRRLKEKIKEKLEKNELRMKQLLSECIVKEVHFSEEKLFANINTKEEYENLLRMDHQ